MADSGEGGSGVASTLVASLLGPAAAVLYELDIAPLRFLASLGPILVVSVVAFSELVVGVHAMKRPPRWVALPAMVFNGLVLALYGFFLLFFGLGGSR